jgi:hypothetical protein
MIVSARRSRSCWSGSAIEVWCRMNKCFIVPLQISILMEENNDGETALSLHVPLQLLHLRLDHQVNRFMGCDCHIEELHRGLKQLTGSEKCQCRAARAQRNHLACCYQAWVSLKVKAKELGQTLYDLRSSLFSDYLWAELRHPRIVAC